MIWGQAICGHPIPVRQADMKQAHLGCRISGPAQCTCSLWCVDLACLADESVMLKYTQGKLAKHGLAGPHKACETLYLYAPLLMEAAAMLNSSRGMYAARAIAGVRSLLNQDGAFSQPPETRAVISYALHIAWTPWFLRATSEIHSCPVYFFCNTSLQGLQTLICSLVMLLWACSGQAMQYAAP